MYFLALSQAPPAFDMKIAIITPQTNAPASIPPSAAAPSKYPTTRGVTTAKTPGIIISWRAACVEIPTHDL